MAAVRQQLDKQALKALVPLNGLSHSHFDELVAKSEVKELPAGRFLFREGDRDGLTYFLLAGEVTLMQGREVKQTLSAGSSEACHPIGHAQPRQWSAKSNGRVSVLAVDSGLLDVLLAWDQANSYEVTDIQSEDDEDWMTRMLSSELFQRLPANNIQQLLMRMQEVEIDAGTRVVTQDEEGDYYYIIKQGTADVTRRPSSQARPVTIAQLRDGDSFGEEALLSGGPRNASVTMATKGVLMRLAKTDFDALLREPLIEQVDYQQAQAIAKQGAVWLDVRLPGEFDNAHLPDSRNLPLAAVRDASVELSPNQRFIVCCDTGTRSVGAAFLLSQRGFDALVLRGGLNAVPHEELRRTESAVPASASAEIIKFNSRGEEPDEAHEPNQDGNRAEPDVGSSDTQAKLEAVRAELASVQAQVAERRQQVVTLEQAIHDKEKELRALHRSFENAESMGDDLERLRDELEQSRHQLAQQQAALDDARNTGTEREQELVSLREQAAELQQQVEYAEANRGEQEAQRAALQAELDALRQSEAQQQQALLTNLQQVEDDRDRIRHELDERQQALSQVQAQLAALEQAQAESASTKEEQRKRFEQEIETLKQELQSAGSDRERVQGELDALRGDADTARNVLEAKLTEAEQHSARLAEQLEQQGRRALEARHEIESLQAGHEQAREDQEARLQELQSQLQASVTALAEREASLVAASEQLDALRKERDDEQAQSQQAQDEWHRQRLELEEQVGVLQSQERVLGETVQRLERERDASADDLQARIGELEAELAARNEALGLAEQSLGDLRARADASEQARAEAETALAAREQDWTQTEQTLRTSLEQAQTRADGVGRELQQLRDERDAESQALQARVDALKTDLDARSAESAELERARQELEAQLTSLNAQRDASQSEIEAAKAREQQLASELGQIRQEHEAAEQSLKARIQELESALQARSEATAEDNAERERLQQDLQTLQAQHGAVQVQLDEAQAREAQLHEQLEQARLDREGTEGGLNERIQALESDLSARAEALNARDAERERLESEIQALRVQHGDLQTLRDSEQREWQAARAELESASKAVESEAARVRETLERELAALQSQSKAELERMQRDSARLERDRDDAVAALQKARDEQERRKSELQELQAERKKFKEQIAELESWLVRAERKRDDHEAAIKDREQELSGLRDELDEARRDANVARERAAALQQELDADGRQADERSAELREDAAAARAELRNLEQRLEQAERDVLQAQEARGNAVQAYESLKDEAENLQQELNQLQSQYRDAVQEAVRERDGFEQRLQGVQEQERRARERLEDTTGEQLIAQESLQTLEQEHDTLQRELEHTRAELERARADAERLEVVLAQQEGMQSAAEIDSIRELADQELRHAASEIAGLKGELEEARHQVRHLEDEIVLLRQLDGEADLPVDESLDIQRHLDERLAEYKRDADAALASVREQNVSLQNEVQRLQRAGVSDELPPMRAGEPSGRRFEPIETADTASREPRRGTPAWLTILFALLAVSASGAAWWFWQQQASVADASAAQPPAAPAVSAPVPAPVSKPVAAKPERAAAVETESQTAAEPAPMRPGRTYQDFLDDGSLGPVMVQLPGGSFTMGSAKAAPYFDERPARTVTVQPFSMAKYEVTFSDYDRFAKATARDLPADNGWGRDRRPVIGVSWTDAQAYAQWLSTSTGHRYRLPTEAEWEYAARAGTDTFFWWGNEAEDSRANCFNCAGEWSGGMTAPVGSFAANPMGLYDTAGNAMEWVQDCYRDNYQGAPTDGSAVESADCGARVARGGSYRSVLENLRSSRRAQYSPDTRLDQIGFRLVREL